MRTLTTKLRRLFAHTHSFLFGNAWRGLRLLAAGIVLAALTLAGMSRTTLVCADQAVERATEQSATTPIGRAPQAATQSQTTKGKSFDALPLCHMLQPADAAFVSSVLFVLLLLAPEINEFSAFGVSVKRRIQEAKQAASEAKEETRLVEARIQQQIQNLQVTASATSATQLFFGSAEGFEQMAQRVTRERIENDALLQTEHLDIEQMNTSADEDMASRSPEEPFATDLEPQPSASPVSEPPKATPSHDEAYLAQHLIGAWEEIARLAGLGHEPPLVAPNVARRFAMVYAREIEALQAARNSVAHARQVDPAALASSVHLADRLLSLLRDPPTY